MVCVEAIMMRVYDGEIGEKEKQNGLCTMKRGEMGNMRVVRNSLMRAACAAT